MANLASLFKAEVARLVRKELRADSERLKKTVSSQRSDIAALKRRVNDLEKALKALSRQAAKPSAAAHPAESTVDAGRFRFRAAGMASNRKRLGLSAADFGVLVGTTGQSVYLWESGKMKPKAEHLAAIAALRGVGKREVAERLKALKQSS